MRDISLKGVARQYGGITQGFSVRDAILGSIERELFARESLHAALSSMARRDFFFDRSECIFDWRAGFVQTWTHIHVNICLLAESLLLQTALDSLIIVWQPAIEDTWSNRWACGRPGELPCRLTLSVFLNDSIWDVAVQPELCFGHHGVTVLNGSGRANKSTWYVTDSGLTAAHEVGHMLGLADEYIDSDCPDRNPVDTDTIMDNGTSIPARLMTRFANNIGSNVVAI